MSFIGWLRIIGDTIFIIFGALPFLAAACKTWSGMRGTDGPPRRAAARQ